MSEEILSRRQWLGALSLPATALALPGVSLDDPEDLRAAGQLAGIAFSPEECRLAAGRIARQKQDVASLRQQAIPFSLPPCATFDPVPPGRARPVVAAGVARNTMPWQPLDGLADPTDDKALAFASLDELATWLHHGKVTSRKLTELALARLQAFDARLLCVVTLLREEALARADALDAERRAGTVRSPLHGIPYGAKDLFAWPSAPTTFGAEPYRDHVWSEKATVLARLEDAGAVLVAKLSLGALAMGDLWYGGRTRSPWDPDRGSSGSSAGSAAAVAACLVPFALGSETLGSIVSPCTACGVGGLRPTFGAVSRHGAMPLSWTMDKVGVIARRAADAARVFDVIRGTDGLDPAVRDMPFDWAPSTSLAGLRIGVLQGKGVLEREEDARFLAWLRDQGLEPRPVALPEAPLGAMLLMLNAESAAAFDELTRSGGLAQLQGQRESDWPNQFRAARAIPAVEYVQASRIRTAFLADMARALEDIDVLVAPTHGPVLSATNLSGHPTFVLPVGTGANGGRPPKPTVLSLVGCLYGERHVLRLAAAWQRTTNWHLQVPPLTA